MLPFYQVDAFTHQPFSGNPAAVCPLRTWLPDDQLQAIAAENNLSETAFFVRATPGVYELRWFTPTIEVELCGHATLASAHVLFTELDYPDTVLRFQTRHRGELTVTQMQPGHYCMALPNNPAQSAPAPESVLAALGLTTVEVAMAAVADNWLLELKSEATMRLVCPDFVALAQAVPDKGVIVTAAAEAADVDFVSRFFAPAFGVNEDPVTGSAHATLVPHWAQRLGVNALRAQQASARGGELQCEFQPAAAQVHITGQAITVIAGQFFPFNSSA